MNRLDILAKAKMHSIKKELAAPNFFEGALRLDIWLDENRNPIRGEILHDGMRILTLSVANFQIL